MPRHRSVVAVAVATLATSLTVSAAAVAHPSAHANKHAAGHSKQFGLGNHWGHPGPGHHHPNPSEPTPPGTTAAWGDVVGFAGFESTPLGEVNGFTETKAGTTSPSTSEFTLFPGVEGLTGTENITIYSAVTPPGTTAETSVTQDAGLDECNPCTLDNASGQPVATGSIDMHWFSASGEKGAHQQVALLEHGTGGLAGYHGVLTHPGATDSRCAAGAPATTAPGTAYVGCYTGTIHDDQCITGVTRGLIVAPGQSVCVSPGAEILGRTVVGRDSELFAEGAAFLGGIRSEGAAGFSLCGSDVNGPVSVTGTTGPVLIGEPSTGDCEGNTIFGPLTVAGNGCATCDANGMDTGAVDVSGDTVIGPLRAEDNVGAFVLGYFTPNRVFGPTTNSGNS